MNVKRGQIYYADLSPVKGSEQGGYRPVLILQNNVGNKYAPTTIAAIITSRHTKHKLPTHYWLTNDCGLPKDSMVECEQVKTLDKTRLLSLVGEVSQRDMSGVEQCLRVSLGLTQ